MVKDKDLFLGAAVLGAGYFLSRKPLINVKFPDLVKFPGSDITFPEFQFPEIQLPGLDGFQFPKIDVEGFTHPIDTLSSGFTASVGGIYDTLVNLASSLLGPLEPFLGQLTTASVSQPSDAFVPLTSFEIPDYFKDPGLIFLQGAAVPTVESIMAVQS